MCLSDQQQQLQTTACFSKAVVWTGLLPCNLCCRLSVLVYSWCLCVCCTFICYVFVCMHVVYLYVCPQVRASRTGNKAKVKAKVSFISLTVSVRVKSRGSGISVNNICPTQSLGQTECLPLPPLAPSREDEYCTRSYKVYLGLLWTR